LTKPRVVGGIILIAVGLLALVIFLKFILPFQPDMLTIWAWIMLVTSILGAGMGIFSGFSILEIVAAVLFLLLTSLIFFIPFPANIGELVWPLWLLFLACLFWIYNKYKKRNKNPPKTALAGEAHDAFGCFVQRFA
jgi:hypothetical protein